MKPVSVLIVLVLTIIAAVCALYAPAYSQPVARVSWSDPAAPEEATKAIREFNDIKVAPTLDVDCDPKHGVDLRNAEQGYYRLVLTDGSQAGTVTVQYIREETANRTTDIVVVRDFEMTDLSATGLKPKVNKSVDAIIGACCRYYWGNDKHAAGDITECLLVTGAKIYTASRRDRRFVIKITILNGWCVGLKVVTP